MIKSAKKHAFYNMQSKKIQNVALSELGMSPWATKATGINTLQP